MFSSSLCAHFIALVAYSAAGSAAPGISTVPDLNVKVSTSDANFDGLGNLKVTTTIVNTGCETLKPPNDPSGVLNPFSGDTFTITDPSGSRPSFGGSRVNCVSGYMIRSRVNASVHDSRLTATPRTPPALMFPALPVIPSTPFTTVSGGFGPVIRR